MSPPIHEPTSVSPPRLPVLIRIIICGIAVSALGISLGHGIRVTSGERSASTAAAWATTDAQESCLYRAIRQQLPKGARIFVGDNSAPTADLLAELSVSWANPQVTRSTARWLVSVVQGPACSGVSLRVRRR